jgi:photosystem II stability/assembly factor-like uncharacterized protein
MGGLRVEDGQVQSTVFTCNDALCLWTGLPEGIGRPKIRMRPDYARSNVMFAFTPNGLYRSSDVWGFAALETPWPADSRLLDVALAGSDGAMFAAVHSIGDGAEGLYRSDDGGDTWSKLSEPLFAGGASSIALAGRRMFVTLPDAGLACSADGGRHWSRRC